MTKAKAAMIFAVIVIIGALFVWFGTDLAERITNVEGLPVEEALLVLASRLKAVALAGALAIWALSGFVIWYARRAIQTGSMPPIGSWIVQGQRVRSGRDAVSAARLLMVLGVFLAILGALELAFAWSVATDIASGA